MRTARCAAPPAQSERHPGAGGTSARSRPAAGTAGRSCPAPQSAAPEPRPVTGESHPSVQHPWQREEEEVEEEEERGFITPWVKDLNTNLKHNNKDLCRVW